MRFNIDRMCDLAGIGNKRSSARTSNLLRESKYNEEMDHFEEMEDEDIEEGLGGFKDSSAESFFANMDEMDHFEEMEDEDIEEGHDEATKAEDENEVIEVDEKELVKELRRMKRIMKEAKRKSYSIARKKKENLQEAQLKAIIDQEVKNVLRDLNLNTGWVYGNKKPTRSKTGFVNHGSFLKGIGFK